MAALHQVLASLAEVGLQQAHQGRNVCRPLPEQGGQQRWKQLHVDLWKRDGMQLYQLRKYLEYVGMEFLHNS